MAKARTQVVRMASLLLAISTSCPNLYLWNVTSAIIHEVVSAPRGQLHGKTQRLTTQAAAIFKCIYIEHSYTP